jgi:EmrB/QacA subfamily drug resistance transporter
MRGAQERPGVTLALLCTGVFVVNLDGTVVAVALPTIQRTLGGGIADLQWIIDAYVLAVACVLLGAGALGDATGRRRVFLAGLAGFTAMSAACAVAPTLDLLIAARVVQGAFGAALLAVSLALVADLYPDPRARAKAIGILAGVGAVAVVLGPVLGGLLVSWYGWQSVFWVNVPIGLATVPALAWLLPARPVRTRRLDLAGQALFAVCAAAATFWLIEGNRLGWGSPLVMGAFVLSVVAGALFVVAERRHPDPMLPGRLVRQPAVALGCTVNFLGFFVLFPTLFLVTLFLQDTSGLSAAQAGVRLLALTGALTVASLTAPPIAARWGTRPTIVVGAALMAAGLVALATVREGTPYGGYWWALALVGLGVPAVVAPATVAALAAVPQLAATSVSMATTFRQLGAVAGIAVTGIVLRPGTDLVAGMPVMFVVTVVAALGCAAAAAYLSGTGHAASPASPARIERG